MDKLNYIVQVVTEAATPGTGPLQGNSGSAVWQGAGPQSLLADVGGGLGIVLLVIIIAAFVYARVSSVGKGKNGVVNVVASQTIGPRERLTIVEVGGKQILIGMTPAAVQTLHVFDQPVVIENVEKHSFADRLRAAMRRKV